MMSNLREQLAVQIIGHLVKAIGVRRATWSQAARVVFYDKCHVNFKRGKAGVRRMGDCKIWRAI
jgi:hypothetical protein